MAKRIAERSEWLESRAQRIKLVDHMIMVEVRK
jgi:hypothetical protein